MLDRYGHASFDQDSVKKSTLESLTNIAENKKVPMIQELRCSRYTTFLTFFMIPFPVTYLIFASFIFELDSKGIFSVVLSPLFYLASFFWIITGVGLRRLKKWSWYTLLCAEFFITYLNALNLVQHSNSQYKVWAFILTILIQGYVLVYISREIRVPFLYPKIRWWESGIAGMPHLSVMLNHLSSTEGRTSGQILDMNLKGCFIKTHYDYPPFEKVNLEIEAFGQKIEISGMVVWNAKSTVTHPKGIGIRFNEMDRKRKRVLRVIVQRFLRQKEPKYANQLSV
jgi:Tfp pilus assembly protein PilZ